MRPKPPKFQFVPLQLVFLLFSMLLNCMGIIILKYSAEHSYNTLGSLEFFKDIPIALVSLLAVNFIDKYGSKFSLKIALLLVTLCCAFLPLVNHIWFFRIWFALIGVSFAISKISVFGLIRSNSSGEIQLSKIMSRVESSFMLGIFLVNMGFGYLLKSQFEEMWKFGFWIIGALGLITLLFFSNTSYKEVEKQVSQNRLTLDFSLLTKRTILFLLILFFIVFFEQGFNSWLPTFYKTNLGTNSFLALQSVALLALFSYLGRVITSRILQKFSWGKYIAFCLSSVLLLLLVCEFLILESLSFKNLFFFLFPLIGFFISPIYPLYNSKLLAHTDENKVNTLISFIVIVSSLGGSFGSLFMSYIFHFGKDNYFLLFSLLPILVIILLTLIFKKSIFQNLRNHHEN